MRIRKKLVQHHSSRAVIIPRVWFKEIERDGDRVLAIDLEIRPDMIILRPVFVLEGENNVLSI